MIVAKSSLMNVLLELQMTITPVQVLAAERKISCSVPYQVLAVCDYDSKRRQEMIEMKNREPTLDRELNVRIGRRFGSIGPLWIVSWIHTRILLKSARCPDPKFCFTSPRDPLIHCNQFEGYGQTKYMKVYWTNNDETVGFYCSTTRIILIK